MRKMAGTTCSHDIDREFAMQEVEGIWRQEEQCHVVGALLVTLID